MKNAIVLFFVTTLLLAASFGAVPCSADADTSSFFAKVVVGALATQHQEEEDVSGTFQLEAIRLIPWIPWHVGGMLRYSTIFQAGEDQTDYNGRIIVFGKDPNASELNGEWVPFLTIGGLELHDNEEESKDLARENFDGSVGVIWPLAGMNLVTELGGRRMAGETYWSFGVGFFLVPKL